MLTRIDLKNVKTHKQLSLNIQEKITLLYGENGVGKTTILEALSLFTIGRGIFSIDKNDMLQNNTENYKIDIDINENEFSFLYYAPKEKTFSFKKNTITSKTIQEYIKIFGISPYISLAFWNDIEICRKIINRIIMQHNPIYWTHFKEYNKILKQRNLLIKNNTFNNHWSHILDPQLKKHGLIINKIREEVISRKINKSQEIIEQFLQDQLILEMSPNFGQQEMILNQTLDLNFQGPHLTRFHLKTKNTQQNSTGQQKKLLLALLIINAAQNNDSILLLDDVFHNLDDQNIIKLIQLLSKQNFQTIITHTSPIDYPTLHNIQII